MPRHRAAILKAVVAAPLVGLLVACGGGGGAADVATAAAAATSTATTTSTAPTVAPAAPATVASTDESAATAASPTDAAAATVEDAHATALAAITSITASAVASSTSTAWTTCASEGQSCSFSGTKQVRYGAGSSWVILTRSGGTPCTNAVFNDPANGVIKTCAFAEIEASPTFNATNWTLCSTGGTACNFTGTRQVRYGTATQAVVQTFTATASCTNAVFGDPAWGSAKSCWYANDAIAVNWVDCAAENQRCTFTGTALVRYGVSNKWMLGTFTDGVDCNNGTFGDPAVNAVKTCSRLVVTSAGVAATAATASVTLPTVTLAAVGSPAQIVASVLDAKGATAVNPVVTWTVADPTVATVSSSGRATPLRVGYTVVTATANGRSATTVLSVRGPTPIPTRSQYVGTNLAGIAYWGTSFPFVDMMKSGGGWGSRDNNGNWGAAFPTVSADGYPTSLAPGQHALAPVAWNNTRYPAGQYVVLWDGDGTISFPLSNVRIVSSAANRIVVQPNDQTSAMWVGIDATNATNPVRNVRFLWPGSEATYATQPFNPAYLGKVAPFSMLRFMDWGQTNGSPIVEWADRPLPTNATYATPKGVPLEVMIDLANTLHVDPWFCIPHQASDDYVRKFATLLHTRLDPTLRPHVEYSNEVWNTGFSQNAWAAAQSAAKGLARPSGMPSVFFARRSVQIFKAMQAVYGTADAHRLVRVIAGQSDWLQFLQDALADTDTASNADVMAIAPYFNAKTADDPANLSATLALTPSQIVDQWLAHIRGPVKSQMGAAAVLASQYKLKLRAYESGPGDNVSYFPAANQAALTALFSAANASPRMNDVYTEYFGQWKAAGGGTMNQFVDISAWTMYGFWGSMQYVTDDPAASPKYQGLMSFIGANPTTTQQTTLQTASSAAK